MSVTIEFIESKNQFAARKDGKIIGYRNSRKTLEAWCAKQGHSVESAATVPAMTKKSEFSVSERFDFIEKFVGMVAKRSIPSMIVTGNGGIGKTYCVTNTLAKLGKVEMGYGMSCNLKYDWLTIKGFSTPKALYRTLFDNNGKTIVFDDCDSVFKDPIASNILKGALDSSEKRIISWGSEMRGEDDLPSSFEFTGQVIFISNLSLQKFPQALLSRSVKVDLTLNTEELIDRIEMILNEQHQDADDVVSFIKENGSKFTDLNVRSALTCLKIRNAMGKGWERIALYQATA